MSEIHPFPPIYDKYSKVLILGSFPSVRSREVGFYYGHPRNKFWKTLETVYQEEIGKTKEEKITFLKKHHIALFDVLKECEINLSKDTSIKNPIPNNISSLLKDTNIKAIYTNGKKAYQLYQKYIYPKTKIEAIYFPSTSPANCTKDSTKKRILIFQQIKTITDSNTN